MASAAELAELGIHVGDEAELSQSELFYDDAENSINGDPGAEPTEPAGQSPGQEAGQDADAVDAPDHAEQDRADVANAPDSNEDEELFYEESALEVDHEDVTAAADCARASSPRQDDIVLGADTFGDGNSGDDPLSHANDILSKVEALIGDNSASDQSETKTHTRTQGSSPKGSASKVAHEAAAVMQSNPHVESEFLSGSGRRMSTGPSLQDELASFQENDSDSEAGKTGTKSVDAADVSENAERKSPGAESNPSTTVASKSRHDNVSDDSELDEDVVRMMTAVPLLSGSGSDSGPKLGTTTDPNKAPQQQRKRRQSVDTGVGPDPPPATHTGRPTPLEISHDRDDETPILISENDKLGAEAYDRGRCCGAKQEDGCVIL